nr:hypothetical protein [Tanacetum cinerariifolium]
MIYENAKLRAQLFDKVSEQKDTAKGTSVNTQFCKQLILGKPPSSSGSKLYAITPFPKSKGLPKIDETHALSKIVTPNSVLTPQETKVVKNDNVIAPRMFRINPFKPSSKEKSVPNKVRASVRTNSITASQPHVITNKGVNSNLNGLSSIGCLITANHDVCALNYVNDMNSCGKKQKENVSNTENQKKQKLKVMKPKKVRLNERLASPKPSKPRSCLKWSPIGRLFDRKGKIIVSSESENQSDYSNGDNACISNPQEPTRKWFPNFTFSLASHSNLFMVCKLRMLIAHDRQSEASYKFHLEVLGNFYFGNDHVTAILGYGKCKRASHPPKPFLNSKQRLHLLHMDLCGPMRIASINGKRVYNRRTKKIMEPMNVTYDELLAMAFEQRSLKPRLQSMTSGQINSGLDLTYARSTLTTQQPIEHELDLLLEAMYDDYIGGQLSLLQELFWMLKHLKFFILKRHLQQ